MLTDNWTHSAASKHTTAPTSHNTLSLCKHPPEGATQTEVADIWLQLTTHLLTPKGWKAELAWLTCSRWFTHISGHPSATGRAQDRDSSLAEDRHSATVPHNQQSFTQWSKRARIRWCIRFVQFTRWRHWQQSQPSDYVFVLLRQFKHFQALLKQEEYRGRLDSLTSFFSTNMNDYIKDEKSRVESYPYPVK